MIGLTDLLLLALITVFNLLKSSAAAPMERMHSHDSAAQSLNPFWGSTFPSLRADAFSQPHSMVDEASFHHAEDAHYSMGTADGHHDHLDVNHARSLWNPHTSTPYPSIANGHYNHHWGAHLVTTPDHHSHVYFDPHIGQTAHSDMFPGIRISHSNQKQLPSSQLDQIDIHPTPMQDQRHSKGTRYLKSVQPRQAPHQQASSSSFTTIVERPARLNEYEWQRPLSEDAVMELYRIIVNRWKPAGKSTSRSNLERLNTFLEQYPSYVEKILDGNEKAIVEVLTSTGPRNSRIVKNAKSHEPIRTPEEILTSIRNPLFVMNKNQNPIWAPKNMNTNDQRKIVDLLHKTWMMERSTVRTKLKRMGRDMVAKWAPKLLDKNQDKAQDFARKLDQLWKDIGTAKKEFAQTRRHQMRHSSDTGTASPRHVHQREITNSPVDNQQDSEEPFVAPMSDEEYLHYLEAMESHQLQFTDNGPEDYTLDYINP